ncbi:3-oxoacid CoA-transferase subunit A [uncultured Arsenicicoccus sp.]|uniref:3-oxoacid CoA-transferase subunit A n=1 Tax=uncultured Arsenicicoccus sp. TaxID=491339 RepID=UPI00259A489A|nr:3-oxoacid CoA-transferase subunit A [uncultured Arsenicicoccus sp.]
MSGLHVAADVDEAVSIVEDGDTVLIGGFGIAGQPVELIEALIRSGVSGLTVVNNNAGNGDEGLAALIKNGQVARMICSFPRQSDSWHFDEAYRAGRIELEVVPQGTLAERIRAGGAGIGGFLTPTAYGTLLAEGKETRVIDGRGYVLEAPITGDVALVKALRSDAMGNLVYRKTARNFGPAMCTAVARSVVQVEEVVPAGQIDPEVVVTPGIFVDTVVEVRTTSSDKEGLR